MAKGNLFQGQARGKVGDVVFTRLDGEQISRVRNRHPKNPKTNKQLLQRAIMATIMQAYSSGKEIFDHSFQGKAVGAANQRHFMSINSKLLRSLLATDLVTTEAAGDQPSRFVAPGSLYPVPFNGMIVSQGTYDQRLFMTVESGVDDPIVGFQIAPPTEGQTVAQYAAANGLIPDDLYTIIAYIIDTDANPVFDAAISFSQYPARFEFIRLRVRNSVLTDNTSIAAATFSSMFELEKSAANLPFDSGSLVTAMIDVSKLNQAGLDCGAIAVIRSREDEDLRSNSELVFGGGGNAFGLTAADVLDAWKRGAVSLGESELILEGADL